jgi:hypothetical protein
MMTQSSMERQETELKKKEKGAKAKRSLPKHGDTFSQNVA